MNRNVLPRGVAAGGDVRLAWVACHVHERRKGDATTTKGVWWWPSYGQLLLSHSKSTSQTKAVPDQQMQLLYTSYARL